MSFAHGCHDRAGYYAPKDWDGPAHARGGLLPRWSRDGRFVAFDSAHIWGTGSQMYVAGVQQLKIGWPAAAAPARDPPARLTAPHVNPCIVRLKCQCRWRLEPGGTAG